MSGRFLQNRSERFSLEKRSFSGTCSLQSGIQKFQAIIDVGFRPLTDSHRVTSTLPTIASRALSTLAIAIKTGFVSAVIFGSTESSALRRSWLDRASKRERLP